MSKDFYEMVDEYRLDQSIRKTFTPALIKSILDKIASLSSRENVDIDLVRIIWGVYKKGYTDALDKSEHILRELAKEERVK